MSDHKHTWKGSMHLDGCHHYTNTYNCACGATVSVSGERQFRSRGQITPSIMMASEGDCTRCTELINGKRRRPTQYHLLADKANIPANHIGWYKINRAKLKEITA